MTRSSIRLAAVTTSVFFLFGLYAYLVIRPELGFIPAAEKQRDFLRSAHFDPEKRRFVNLSNDQTIVDSGHQGVSLWQVLGEWWKALPTLFPEQPLPTVRPNLGHRVFDAKDDSTSAASARSLQYVWLGHSTLLVRVAETTLLIDPVFSNAAAPVSFLAPRFQPPVLQVRDLPPVDYVLISHDHYDHLDMQSIKSLRTQTEARFLVPLGVGRHLEHWGMEKHRIQEFDWWQSMYLSDRDLQLVFTPAQHFSGRLKPYENQTLWGSWAALSPHGRMYYSGDTGFGPHLGEIGQQLGPFDIVFMENGQYNRNWSHIHITPEDGLLATARDLKGTSVMPVHWGAFALATHSWFDPIVRAVQASAAMQNSPVLLTPKLGEVVEVSEKGIRATKPWFNELIPGSR